MRPITKTQRKGSVLTLTPLLIMLLCAMTAFAVDMGYMYVVRTQLQSAADASAMAACMELREDADPEDVDYLSIHFATLNEPTHGDILVAGDIVTGVWDFESQTFASGAADPNAVKTTIRREGENSVGTFFMNVFSVSEFGANASSTAAYKVETNDDGDEVRKLPEIVN